SPEATYGVDVALPGARPGGWPAPAVPRRDLSGRVCPAAPARHSRGPGATTTMSHRGGQDHHKVTSSWLAGPPGPGRPAPGAPRAPPAPRPGRSPETRDAHRRRATPLAASLSLPCNGVARRLPRSPGFAETGLLVADVHLKRAGVTVNILIIDPGLAYNY